MSYTHLREYDKNVIQWYHKNVEVSNLGLPALLNYRRLKLLLENHRHQQIAIKVFWSARAGWAVIVRDDTPSRLHLKCDASGALQTHELTTLVFESWKPELLKKCQHHGPSTTMEIWSFWRNVTSQQRVATIIWHNQHYFESNQLIGFTKNQRQISLKRPSPSNHNKSGGGSSGCGSLYLHAHHHMRPVGTWQDRQERELETVQVHSSASTWSSGKSMCPHECSWLLVFRRPNAVTSENFTYRPAPLGIRMVDYRTRPMVG